MRQTDPKGRQAAGVPQVQAIRHLRRRQAPRGLLGIALGRGALQNLRRVVAEFNYATNMPDGVTPEVLTADSSNLAVAFENSIEQQAEFTVLKMVPYVVKTNAPPLWGAGETGFSEIIIKVIGLVHLGPETDDVIREATLAHALASPGILASRSLGRFSSRRDLNRFCTMMLAIEDEPYREGPDHIGVGNLIIKGSAPYRVPMIDFPPHPDDLPMNMGETEEIKIPADCQH